MAKSKATDDNPIVRDEAAAMDAESNKRAVEDKAAADNSRTAREKAGDAARRLKLTADLP